MTDFWVALIPGISGLLLAAAGYLKAHTTSAKVDTHLNQVNGKTVYTPPK